jgi:hypothetical protein
MATEDLKPKLEIVDVNSDNQFDLNRLCVDPKYLETTSVKKLPSTPKIRKPRPQEFVRVHPDPKYRALMAFIELKEDNEVYVVDPSLLPELQSECYIATLFLAMTRSGEMFLRPVRVPATEGRKNEWHQAMARAAEVAMKHWVRIRANMAERTYDIYIAENEASIPPPEWPKDTYQEIVSRALKDILVNYPNHPLIKRLRGG